jgi:urease accessory protein
MAVITSIVGRGDLATAGYGIDPLVLSSEERASGHFTAETAAGRIVRVSLPRGTELQDGDVLLKDGQWAIVVRAAEEDLLLLRPGDDPLQWSAACYQLGNLHRPARFLPDGILTPYDPMAVQVLSGLAVVVERVKRPFLGRRFGAAGAHHHHGDDAHEHRGHSHEDGEHGHVHHHHPRSGRDH